MSYWREKVKRGQFGFGGWSGTILGFHNDPPVWLPEPSWPHALVAIAVIEFGWKPVTAGLPSDQEIVPLLLELLQDDDPLVRRVAAGGLSPYGSHQWRSLVVPALARALQDRYADVRLEAARTLSIQEPTHIEPAIRRAAEEVIRAGPGSPRSWGPRWVDPSLRVDFALLAHGERLPPWLENVGSLTATGTAVTDADLPHLRKLPLLERLDLSDTRVTDAGMATLEGLPRLQKVVLTGTAVSEVGIRRLRHARPALVVAR